MCHRTNIEIVIYILIQNIVKALGMHHGVCFNTIFCYSTISLKINKNSFDEHKKSTCTKYICIQKHKKWYTNKFIQIRQNKIS